MTWSWPFWRRLSTLEEDEKKIAEQNALKQKLQGLIVKSTQRADEIREEIRLAKERIQSQVDRQLDYMSKHRNKVDETLAEETNNLIIMKNDLLEQYKRALGLARTAHLNFNKCVETLHMHGIQRESLVLSRALNLPNTDETSETTNELNETNMEMDISTKTMSSRSILANMGTGGGGIGRGGTGGTSEYTDMMEEAVVSRLQFPMRKATTTTTEQQQLETIKEEQVQTQTTTTKKGGGGKSRFDHLFVKQPTG